MPGSQPRPTDPAWRKGATPGQRKQESLKPWQRDTTAAPPGMSEGRRKNLKIGLGLLGILGSVIGLIVLILLLMPAKPTYVALLGAGYETNLAVPHNAYGWQGLKDLHAWIAQRQGIEGTWDSGKLKCKDPQPLTRDNLATWQQDLEAAEGKNLVVFLACHGGADQDGAYLFLNDARYGNKDDVLRIHDVLEALRPLAEGQKKNVVLILDATQVAAHWPSGMLYNSFVEKLEQDVNAAKIPNLVVISASDVDERSWVHEKSRQTVFMHYVIEGLGGEADANHNDRITALELYDYVAKKVEAWVAATHNQAKQTPLLLPREGGRDRAESIDLVMVRNAPAQADTQRDSFKPRDSDLDRAWGEWEGLRAQVPSPAVYSPHLWRRYQDTLLRYEQLLRAGSEQAQALPDILHQLREVMKRGQRDRLSAQNSLAMPAALGLRVRKPDLESRLSALVDQLWKARDPKQPAEALRNLFHEDAEAEKPLRMKYAGLLLDYAVKNPKENVPGAADWLKKLEDSGTPRPAEAHLLYMVDHLYKEVLPRDGDTALQPTPNLVGAALDTRRLAEGSALAIGEPGVHPYSEQVYRWIQEKVGRGDRERRLGEDLLFAAGDSWDKAGTHLKKARETYEDARRDAADVRKGLDLRDRVLSDLPYYAQWLVHYRDKDEEQWLDHLDKLARETHELTQVLATPPQAGLQSPERERVKSLTESIAEGFKKLVDKFDSYCDGLQNARQEIWYETETALSIPLIGRDLRMKLLTSNVAAAAELGASAERNTSSKPDENKSKALAHKIAQRQGRVAVSLLGEGWIKESSDTARKYLLEDVQAPREPDWHGHLTIAGEKLGQCWRKLPATINELTAAGQKSEPKDATLPLSKADRLARLLDGPAAGEAARLDPVIENRNVKLHNLLLWQARRAFEDHWFDENQKPYYLAAGRAYVDDAIDLVAGSHLGLEESASAARQKQAREMLALLQRQADIQVEAPRALDITSEKVLELSCRLRLATEILPGFPVLWKETGKNEPVKKLVLDQGKESDRKVVEEFGRDKPLGEFVERFSVKNQSLQSDEKRPPAVPRTDRTEVALRGVYRGQLIGNVIPVTLHRGADITTIQCPRPNSASLAVRADKSIHQRFAPQSGAIAIVVDYSGSMKEREGGKRRIDQALDSLEEVLDKLPDGVTVSLWIFGQVVSRNAPLVEDTIERIQPPIKWKRAELADLMNKLRPLVPEYGTPLVRTMIEAARQDLKGRGEGFKTLLVLTDGMDTRFVKGTYEDESSEGDPVYNPNSQKDLDEVPRFLRKEFEGSGIEINMILFQLKEAEGAKARRQFKVIESLTPPGKLLEAKDTAELVNSLRRSITQELRCRLIRSNNRAVAPADGLKVTRTEANPQWFAALSPDTYKALVHNFDPQEVSLNAGDCVLATLTSNGFERALLADEHKAQKVGDWQVGVLQDQLLPGNQLQLKVSLEEHAHRAARPGQLGEPRPTFTWFEVEPQGQRARLSLRLREPDGYPAPVTELDVVPWPRPSNPDVPVLPVLHAWWLSGSRPRAEAVLQRNPALALAADFKQPVQVEGGDVLIESVQLEKWAVQVSPDDPDKKERECLVVRLRYPKDRPVLARLEVLRPAGQEHRLYKEANKYTGIFWPVKESDAQNFALELISLNAFKKAALSNQGRLLDPPSDLSYPILRAPLAEPNVR